jgi:hypothetical protein
MKKVLHVTFCVLMGFALNAQVSEMSVNPTSIYEEVDQGTTGYITKQITVTNSGSGVGDYNTWIEYDFEPKEGSSVFELRHCEEPDLFGAGYDDDALLEFGVKFSGNDLYNKIGTYITKMSYYLPDHIEDDALTFRIYGARNNDSPGEILMEFTKTDNVIYKWNEITLPQPLLIDKSELWLSVLFFQRAGSYPIAIDMDMFKKGVNFIKIDDGSWFEFPDKVLGNFTIKAEAIGAPVPCWLSLSGDTYGSISGGSSANFNVALLLSGLPYDAHRANITMATNDLNNPVIKIPSTLVVLPSQPAPIVYVTPKSIDESASETGIITKQITVTNYGNAAGIYEAWLEGVSGNWISLTGNISGSVAGGNNHENFNAVINTAGLDYGTYTATLKVSTNDIKHPLFVIPCTLVFEPAAPEISVSPNSIDEIITESGTITKPITITNSGNAAGTYNAWLEGVSNDWISLSGATTGTVSGGSSTTFDVLINADELDYGPYPATIKISTNDPNNSLFEIPCTIIVSKENIASTTLDNQITVYPNPTTGQLRITGYRHSVLDTESPANKDGIAGEIPCRSTGRNDVMNVDVFDVMGRQFVSNLKSQTSNLLMDISHLPSGIYFVRITIDGSTSSPSGSVVTKKIIKK